MGVGEGIISLSTAPLVPKGTPSQHSRSRHGEEAQGRVVSAQPPSLQLVVRLEGLESVTK